AETRQSASRWQGRRATLVLRHLACAYAMVAPDCVTAPLSHQATRSAEPTRHHAVILAQAKPSCMMHSTFVETGRFMSRILRRFLCSAVFALPSLIAVPAHAQDTAALI